jgi:ribosomal protein L11 methyltransferase
MMSGCSMSLEFKVRCIGMAEADIKSWRLITVEVAREVEEMASQALFELGTTGIITLEESIARVRLGAYFDAETDAEKIIRELRERISGDSISDVSTSEVANQDWMEKWKEGFDPVPIGERLIIAPSWKLPTDAGGRRVVRVDPGMAFGTGTHDTTRMCLEAIERHWHGGSMLDVGTGTGILAIAAAKLGGSSRILGIDVDPVAVEVARENVSINEVADLVEIREGQPGQMAGQMFDMVVANLTAEVIIDLMADLTGCLTESGLLILSGILTELRPDVEQRATDSRLEIIERQESNEWSLVVACKG